MGRIEARLQQLGLTLPAPMNPPGNFKLVKIHAGIAYIAGHPPIDGSNILVEGMVGRDLTLEEGYHAARLTALSILASLKLELGDLDRVTDWLRVVGYVQTAPGFSDNAKVVNGFSDLIADLGAMPGAMPDRHRGRALLRSTSRSSWTQSWPLLPERSGRPRVNP